MSTMTKSVRIPSNPLPPQAAESASGLRETLVSAVIAAGLVIPVLGIGGGVMYSDFRQRTEARLAFEHLQQSHARLVASPASGTLPAGETAHGRDLFGATCAACHGMDGKGVAGLGKDLTQSWFVASLDDGALRTFIADGRGINDPYNTTRIPMPGRGGRMDLTDADLGDIALYVRGLQDPRRLPELPAAAVTAVTEADKAKALASAGGDAELAEFIAHGTKVFAVTCSACHGKDGKGLRGLGKDLTDSEFARKLDDDGLLAFIKRGRDPSDPANTTKVGMPPKGGNPALSDDDLLDVIAFVRTLQKHDTQ